MSQLKRSRVPQIEKKKILNATTMTQCSQINKLKKIARHGVLFKGYNWTATTECLENMDLKDPIIRQKGGVYDVLNHSYWAA